MEILLIVVVMAACCGLPLLLSGLRGSGGRSRNRDQSLTPEAKKKDERKQPDG